MIVLLATAGRPDSLRSTLRSLSSVSKPSQFDRVIVVENGPAMGADAICQTTQKETKLPIEYQHCLQAGKSVALNWAIEKLHDDALLVMTDDDMRFDSRILEAYAQSVEPRHHQCFYGGPFGVDYEAQPPDWLLPYLPPSAKGWAPSVDDFDETHDFFMGCNWAAYVGDLKWAGGFDPRFGPGSVSGATGQEREMQRRLYDCGLTASYIPDAFVRHYVPRERCSPEWAISRGYRSGISRGVAVSSRGLATRLHDHTLNTLRLAVTSAGTVLSDGNPETEQAFKAQYYRSRSQGYFKGIGYRDAG